MVKSAESLLGAEPAVIPDKMFFRVSETSRLVGVPPHVLRFWETEFPALSPKKSGRGHRLYRRKDVELFLQIKHLLYEKRFTIEGARQTLKARAKRPAKVGKAAAAQASLFASAPAGLDQIREELREILRLLR